MDKEEFQNLEMSDAQIKALIIKIMNGPSQRFDAVYISFIIENALCKENIENTTNFIGTEGIKRIRKFIADAPTGN